MPLRKSITFQLCSSLIASTPCSSCVPSTARRMLSSGVQLPLSFRAMKHRMDNKTGVELSQDGHPITLVDRLNCNVRVATAMGDFVPHSSDLQQLASEVLAQRPTLTAPQMLDLIRLFAMPWPPLTTLTGEQMRNFKTDHVCRLVEHLALGSDLRVEHVEQLLEMLYTMDVRSVPIKLINDCFASAQVEHDLSATPTATTAFGQQKKHFLLFRHAALNGDFKFAKRCQPTNDIHTSFYREFIDIHNGRLRVDYEWFLRSGTEFDSDRLFVHCRAYARRGDRSSLERCLHLASAQLRPFDLDRWSLLLNDLLLAGHDALAVELLQSHVPFPLDPRQQNVVLSVQKRLLEWHKWDVAFALHRQALHSTAADTSLVLLNTITRLLDAMAYTHATSAETILSIVAQCERGPWGYPLLPNARSHIGVQLAVKRHPQMDKIFEYILDGLDVGRRAHVLVPLLLHHIGRRDIDVVRALASRYKIPSHMLSLDSIDWTVLKQQALEMCHADLAQANNTNENCDVILSSIC